MDVLLVEDDVRLARSLSAALVASVAADVRVAHTVSEARQLLGDGNRFDVVLLDVSLPDGCGLELLPACGDAPAVVISASADPATVLRAVRLGAAGYLFKDDEASDIATCLLDVVAGRPVASRTPLALLFDHLRIDAADSPLAVLTGKERGVAALLAKGLTYSETAELVGVGLGTIQTHVKNIYRKLEVNSKAELAAWAIRTGLSS